MPRAAEHKQALIHAAARLFRRRGYGASGLNDILGASGAPKGSLYHYFPDGKEQLAETTVKAGGIMVGQTLEELAASSKDGPAYLRGLARLLIGWLDDSGYEEGCPISTVLLEMAGESDKIRAQGHAAYDRWRQVTGDKFVADGVSRKDATALATHTLAAFEGAMMIARVEKKDAAIKTAASLLSAQLKVMTAA
ncbi:MAG: TetR/AcrR family transcriptional regulator [Alphaproteobacteria bacterium]|nr:TetR/AcrR family transcriptional regulator [Alphaproteobacteria bacterium]